MKVKAAVFDLDGTLIDTIEDIADSVNEVLVSYGYPVHGIEDYKIFVGQGAKELVKSALPPTATESLVNEALEKYKKIYGARWNAKSRPYDGILDLLHFLRERKIRVAVLTNKIHSMAEVVLDHFFPHFKFDMMIGESEGIFRKPSPQGALLIAERLNIPAGEIAYLGDTATDIQTAVNAGMIPIGVLWGFRSREELAANGAKHLIQHPLELIALID